MPGAFKAAAGTLFLQNEARGPNILGFFAEIFVVFDVRDDRKLVEPFDTVEWGVVLREYAVLVSWASDDCFFATFHESHAIVHQSQSVYAE